KVGKTRMNDMRDWNTSMRILTLLIAGLVLAMANDAWAQGEIRGPDAEVVGKINELVRQGWTDNEVAPSPQASDSEWLRRVYLDLVGHVPPLEVVEGFVESPPKSDAERAARRSAVVEELLVDQAYV